MPEERKGLSWGLLGVVSTHTGRGLSSSSAAKRPHLDFAAQVFGQARSSWG